MAKTGPIPVVQSEAGKCPVAPSNMPSFIACHEPPHHAGAPAHHTSTWIEMQSSAPRRKGRTWGEQLAYRARNVAARGEVRIEMHRPDC